MDKKVVSLVSLLLIIAVGFSQKAELWRLMKEGGTTAMLVSAILVAICVFFPLIPFPLLAGTIGALFGTFDGLIITLTGAMAGTMGFFFLSRYGFRKSAQARLRQYPKISEYERFLSNHALVSIFLSRVVPIIPAPVVNIACGLSRVKWPSFFVASAIGKIPNILLLSFAGASFTENKLQSFALYGAYLLVLFLIYLVIIFKRKSRQE